MQNNRSYALVFALATAICRQAHAEEVNAATVDPGTTTVEAQRLEIHLDRKMSAFGDAELHRDGNTIFGDRIDYDMLNEELHVTGNTRVEQGGNIVTGPELRMQMEQRVGEMREAVFTLSSTPKPTTTPGQPGRPKRSRGDAKLLTFDGPDKETLKDARYTTCEAGNDDWYLRARELELNHYTQTATATHASVEFKGVPIFYTPWIDFPLTNQRQSGFLSPTFGTTSRSGIDLSLPYYWNIGPNRDATLTPRYMSKRGTQLQGEFRYLEENFEGEDRLEYLPNDNTGAGNRFYANLKHTQTFGNGWSGGFNYERVSDNLYFSDMSTHIVTTSRVNLAQQAQLNYADETWNFNGLMQRYQTLDGASYTYQRLPQLTLNGHKDWDIATGNLYTQAVRFERDSNTPAAITTNLVTGNRFTAYPSVSVPLASAYGYATPKLGMHFTQYDLSGNLSNPYRPGENYQSDSRALPIFSVDSGIYFDRDFRVVSNQYTQTLEPRLFYVYVPHHDQSKLPVFDTALADINMSTLFSENQFVGNDRINDANQLSLAVTSRLIDSKSGTQRLAATIGQRFYFSDQLVTMPGGTARTSNTSDILTAITARLLNHWNLDAAWQYNTDSSETQRANIAARYQPEAGKVLNLGYRYALKSPFTPIPVDQIDLSAQWPMGGNWYGLGRINYSFLNDKTIIGREKGMIEAVAGAEYDAGCWQARAVMQRVATVNPATATLSANANYALFFQLELGGLASIGTSPLSLLKRSIPGYISSELIPDNLH